MEDALACAFSVSHCLPRLFSKHFFLKSTPNKNFQLQDSSLTIDQRYVSGGQILWGVRLLPKILAGSVLPPSPRRFYLGPGQALQPFRSFRTQNTGICIGNISDGEGGKLGWLQPPPPPPHTPHPQVEAPLARTLLPTRSRWTHISGSIPRSQN